MKQKDSAKKPIENLVKYFDKTVRLNEKDTETQLIEPLMALLGWNAKSGDFTKGEADYIFKINGHAKFILEAKAKGVSLSGRYQNKTFVEQSINYAKRSGCTWAVLTNFEEFHLYSVDKKDDGGLVFKINYQDYANSGLDNLWYLSKESMSSSELDKFGEKFGFKKKKQKIDAALLNDLIRFREILSKDILKHNEYLQKDVAQCDDIVQKILDRLIFIRNCEDRDIEKDKLITLAGGRNAVKKFREACKDKDKYGYYNSSLFITHKCDEQALHINDAVLAEIIEGLYKSKTTGILYNFSEIESDVLGSIYEQYLGHLLSKRKKGSLDENLGKKKQQGIYYTPTYIVDYIVRHTLGKALENKSKAQVEKLKVLDMACGSGSFLIKCYELFEQAYLGNYRTEKEQKDKTQLSLSLSMDKSRHLSSIKKCEIIEKNIYGVDLDKQAMEIAQLNLILKIQQKVSLPFTNITCGDSLLAESNAEINIGLFEQFNTEKFDVIVGNPPYVDIKELDAKIVKRLFNEYSTVENRMNLYAVFVEKGLQLLKDGGYFGFIIPNSILYNESYTKIRKMLLENVCLLEIIRLPDNIFEGVKVETIILIFKKDKSQITTNTCNIKIYNADAKITEVAEEGLISSAQFRQADWKNEGAINLTLDRQTKAILNKIEKDAKPLQFYCDFSLGLTPYDAYKGHSEQDIQNKIFHSEKPVTKFHKPLLSGADITRYGVHWNGKNYIKYGAWLGASREQRFFTEPRVIVRQIISGVTPRIYAGYTEKEYYNSQIAFNILIKEHFAKEVSIKYVLALINSNLITFYHREKCLDPTKKLFQKILIANAKKFPIKIPGKVQQDKIAGLTEIMVALSDKLFSMDNAIDEKRNIVLKQMDAIDEKLNNEIFKIYGLSKQEVNSINDTLIV